MHASRHALSARRGIGPAGRAAKRQRYAHRPSSQRRCRAERRAVRRPVEAHSTAAAYSMAEACSTAAACSVAAASSHCAAPILVHAVRRVCQLSLVCRLSGCRARSAHSFRWDCPRAIRSTLSWSRPCLFSLRCAARIRVRRSCAPAYDPLHLLRVLAVTGRVATGTTSVHPYFPGLGSAHAPLPSRPSWTRRRSREARVHRCVRPAYAATRQGAGASWTAPGARLPSSRSRTERYGHGAWHVDRQYTHAPCEPASCASARETGARNPCYLPMQATASEAVRVGAALRARATTSASGAAEAKDAARGARP